jgi:hypothetical protein
MTDQATGDLTATTSTSTTDAAAGGGAAPGGASAAAGTAAPAPFWEAFTSEALKTEPTIQKFKDPEALAGSYLAAQKRLGMDPARLVELPADPADAAAMRAVYERLGAPKTAEEYGLKLPDTADAPSKALVGEFVKVAHEAMVPKGQAETLFKWFTSTAEKAAADQVAQFEAARVAGEAALKAEWGAAYDTRTKEIGRLLNEVGDEALQKDLATKLGNYPSLAKAFGKILDKMAEPGTQGSASGEAADPDRPLTPSAAKAKARELEAHPAFLDRKNPQHKAIVDQRNKALRMAEASAA